MEERQKIINNIMEIYENSKLMETKKIVLEFSASKYSSTKEKTWHIILNNKQITRKDNFVIKYKCVTCNSIELKQYNFCVK
jgi:hypothetical protein